MISSESSEDVGVLKAWELLCQAISEKLSWNSTLDTHYSLPLSGLATNRLCFVFWVLPVFRVLREFPEDRDLVLLKAQVPGAQQKLSNHLLVKITPSRRKGKFKVHEIWITLACLRSTVTKIEWARGSTQNPRSQEIAKGQVSELLRDMTDLNKTKMKNIGVVLVWYKCNTSDTLQILLHLWKQSEQNTGEEEIGGRPVRGL